MKVPPEQWPDVIAALNDQVQATKETSQIVQEAPPTVAPEPEVEVQQPSKEVVKSALPPKPHPAKAKREPHARRRSRSPVRRVRGSPDYGPQNRQRSPQRTISPTLQADKIPLSTKWTGFDRSLPDGHIKVLSRTLFVSGVSCTPEELKSLFAQFGEVQSCTFDARKRQAFLKIVTRAGAEKSKEAMSDPNNEEFIKHVKMTRWGSGFGPRDCSNHETGESIIPIARLSEADYKCALNAEHGGTGGKPLTTGLIVEEPDIDYNPPPKHGRLIFS